MADVDKDQIPTVEKVKDATTVVANKPGDNTAKAAATAKPSNGLENGTAISDEEPLEDESPAVEAESESDTKAALDDDADAADESPAYEDSAAPADSMPNDNDGDEDIPAAEDGENASASMDADEESIADDEVVDLDTTTEDSVGDNDCTPDMADLPLDDDLDDDGATEAAAKDDSQFADDSDAADEPVRRKDSDSSASAVNITDEIQEIDDDVDGIAEQNHADGVEEIADNVEDVADDKHIANDVDELQNGDANAKVGDDDLQKIVDDDAEDVKKDAEKISANGKSASVDQTDELDDVDLCKPTLDAIVEDSQELSADERAKSSSSRSSSVDGKCEADPASIDDGGGGGTAVESPIVDGGIVDDDDEEPEDANRVAAAIADKTNAVASQADDAATSQGEMVIDEPANSADDDDDERMSIDDDVAAPAVNNGPKKAPIVDGEVHAISDSDDDDDDRQPSLPSASAAKPADEAMEVDANASSSTLENGHRMPPSDADDDDKPVSIDSDSDNEHSAAKPMAAKSPAQNNGIHTTPTKSTDSAAEPISRPATANAASDDDDDCMVIEDDDDVPSRPPPLTPIAKPAADQLPAGASLLSPSRRSHRSRKSNVQTRHPAQYDDDVEELDGDSPSHHSAKKAKVAPTAISIQDARTLASSIDSAQNANLKKEPTLVIINTNQPLSASTPAQPGRNSFVSAAAAAATAASVQALQNQNISVHPVTPGQPHSSGHQFGGGLRAASITPVNMATITKAGHGSPASHLNTVAGTTITKTSSPVGNSSPAMPPLAPAPQPAASGAAGVANLLPALTDDMFVLEAPSFIVPYIYEKPPGDNLRDIVERIGRDLAEQKKQEDIDLADSEAKELEAMSAEQRKLAELARAVDANKKKSGHGKRRKAKSGDESWDESDTSTDDESSDTEAGQRTKVLIQEADTDPLNAAVAGNASALGGSAAGAGDPSKRDNYFESPLGRFFIDIGVNLVQEHVQTDLLRQQKKKLHREGDGAAPSVQMAISSLTKNLEHSKTKNVIFKFETKRCEYCNFKSESALAMANHYEAPHLNGQMYRCNFCAFEARPPYDILFHMEAMHNVKARMDRAQLLHQCPNCPFEDNGKSKLARHAAVCLKKYRPEVNLNPPLDWEPPAKIPRIKPRHGLVGTATAYQAMAAQAQRSATNAAAAAAALSLQQQRVNMLTASAAAAAASSATGGVARGRGRPHQSGRMSLAGAGGMNATPGAMMRPQAPLPISHQQLQQLQQQQQQQQQVANAFNRQLGGMAGNFHLNSAGQYVQNYTPPKSSKHSSSSQQQQPSISITPVPKQSNANSNANAITAVAMQMAAVAAAAHAKSSGSGGSSSANAAAVAAAASAAAALSNASGAKPGQAPWQGPQKSFVICEICDGYIKDLDQLRNHMQWMHKVKIHPKMIYNRPPLNCQKCQFRFFTDQGLERHLLGSHGLVTSSMQEAANKGRDAGRCPICGRMYQWKLLNHVSRDHSMTLKPAHLSYKCTVCTATFGMYKQFENHVYSAHSTVTKKSSSEGKSKSSSSSGGSGAVASSSASGSNSLLKPLKINDEITIIPQPSSSRQSRGGAGGSGNSGTGSSNMDSHVIEIL